MQACLSDSFRSKGGNVSCNSLCLALYQMPLASPWHAQVKLFGTPLACPVSGCDTVLTSEYSELYGIPMSLLGMLAYAAVGATAVAAGAANKDGRSTSSLDTLLACGAGLLAGVSGTLM